MFSAKKTNFLMLILVCLLVFSCGCEEKTKPDSAISESQSTKAAPADVKPAEPLPTETTVAEPVKVESAKTPALILNFNDKALDVYKVTTESSKGVAFEGEVPPKSSFKGGQTGSNIEIVFSSQVVSIDDNGNAVQAITVKSVKYKAVVKDNTVIDFDSSKEKDKISPLFGLIDKSYTVKMATNGKMLSVVDANQIRDAVKGESSTHKAAQAIVSDEAIAQRHGSVVLPGDEKISSDTTWKDVESFDFGLMGTQAYEKVYKVNSAENQQVKVSMEAVPSSEMAEEIHKDQQTSNFSRMFDNTESYDGTLVFDAVAGKIKSYSEKLNSHWLAVDPSAANGSDKDAPTALKMSVVKVFSIEKVD